LQKIKRGKYQSKATRVGPGARVIVLNKKQGAVRRSTSRCSRKVLEQVKGIVASNKE
jgi:hypothetical protein